MATLTVVDISLRADEATLRETERAMVDGRTRSVDALEAGHRAASQVLDRIESELARRQAELERSEAELAACQRDTDGDCSEARRRVAVARERLERAVLSRRRATDAIERFTAWDRRISADRDESAHTGGSLLARYRAGLRDYAGLTVSLTAAGSSAAGGHAAGAGAGAGGWVPGLPAGYEMVPLSAIDASDTHVTGPGDFGKGVSPEDLTWAFEAFDKVVLPGAAAGRGPDFFADLDAQQGLSGARSFSSTYSGFLNSSTAIRLDARPDGTYAVGNGYHRIWLATRLGRSSVPAKVHR